MKSSASIVLYNQNSDILNKCIEDILRFTNNDFTLYIVDNSPKDTLKTYTKHLDRVVYIHNPDNPGFGAAHNLALQMALNSQFDYHFVINPDVTFNNDVMGSMLKYMQQNFDIGMMMPQILNSDGTIQNLPKLLPSPFSVLMRKLKNPRKYYERFISSYELRFVDKDIIYNAPILSGCFTLFRLSAVKEVGMYDDNFFMYFEDWDLSRRMHKKYKTVYYPLVSVVHGYESGANKSLKLFRIFLTSAIYYFNKWGWISDRERKHINKTTLKQFL